VFEKLSGIIADLFCAIKKIGKILFNVMSTKIISSELVIFVSLFPGRILWGDQTSCCAVRAIS
jgi:hypothetical protein